jgi:hypothetical protein
MVLLLPQDQIDAISAAQGRPDVRKKQCRPDMRSQRAQITIIPSWQDILE